MKCTLYLVGLGADGSGQAGILARCGSTPHGFSSSDQQELRGSSGSNESEISPSAMMCCMKCCPVYSLQKAMALLGEAEKRGEGSFKPYVMPIDCAYIGVLIGWFPY